MDPERAARCAVSSIPAADRQVLRALERAKVTVVDLRASADVVQALRECQFFVAFVTDSLSATSAIEIGVAVGLRKPMLVIASSMEAVPLVLHRHPIVVRPGLADSDLDLQVRAFAKQFEPRERRRPRTAERPIRDEDVRPRSANAIQPSIRSFEQSREQFRSLGEFRVADLLARAGASVAAQELGERSLVVPDLAATFGDLGPGLSPLLVEVAGLHADFDRKRAQLAEAVRGRGLILGLLVTLDEQPHDPLPSDSVLTLSLAQLETLVTTGDFRSAIQRARNYVAHQAS